MSRERIALVYEHLYPYSVGGAERYYAALAAELARAGPVSYLTRRHGNEAPPGVELVALAAGGAEPPGFVRRNLRKLRFCLALGWHLARQGGRYGAVHCCSFPPAAILAARAGLLPHPRTLLIGDWHEVLSRDDFRGRLGRVGAAGRLVQRLAAQRGDAALTFSRMHERRLRGEGRRRAIAVLPEFPPGGHVPERLPDPAEREPVVLFIGRLVPQKRAHLLAPVVSELRRADPSWRAVVYGDGPEAGRVAGEGVELHGFAGFEELAQAMLKARCLVLPTTREGFGLAVLEAFAHGLPAVLVDEPDNAAVELIAAGENGSVCPDADPRTLAAAVLELAADPDVHARTRAWFDARAQTYSAAHVAGELRALHERLRGAGRRGRFG